MDQERRESRVLGIEYQHGSRKKREQGYQVQSVNRDQEEVETRGPRYRVLIGIKREEGAGVLCIECQQRSRGKGEQVSQVQSVNRDQERRGPKYTVSIEIKREQVLLGIEREGQGVGVLAIEFQQGSRGKREQGSLVQRARGKGEQGFQALWSK